VTAPLTTDLRPTFFGGCEWYETLSLPAEVPTAWWVAKDTEPNIWVGVLNAALAFAVEHDLTDIYARRFAGISPQELRHDRAQRKGRTCSFPIWEIANELLVARYLERVLNWKFDQHEPRGRGERRGDWEFITPAGQAVFTEVKSIREVEGPTGVFSANFTPKVRDAIARAYAQLPNDRGVLVVLVGGGLTLDMPARLPMLSWLFSALFGEFQITFNVMPYDPESTQAGPSFRDRLVHSTKHRRIGCVAALRPGGMDVPSFGFYAIHNPYAYENARIAQKDLGEAFQFAVDEQGRGAWTGELHPKVWAAMQCGS